MAKKKRILINFDTTEEQRERFKRAAAAERMTLAEWLRRLALLRVAELGDRVEQQQS